MEDQCSNLSWAFCHPGEQGMEELRRSLLLTTLELQKTILAAQEEITKREEEIIHLSDLLNRTIKERETAQAKCQKLLLDKLNMLQQQKLKQPNTTATATTPTIPPLSINSGTSSSEDNLRDSSNGFSSSDSEGNTANASSAPATARRNVHQVLQAVPPVPQKPLPEKGKLLKAVMEAGPLLQTLLLAGPLPRWQHPPPQLESIEIPPVSIPSPRLPNCLPLVLQDPAGVGMTFNGCSSSSLSKKRALQMPCEERSNSSSPGKYQRVVNH
ncbi:uncharacterized protein LOC131165443 [Malania oleifera]|uniref:uncharacterized protein LOC131165443 n=1 Tax=Malania oleifera TaxID=397392 RepID=UPI0025AE915B|nr:uncharacterized protein LOC131165443 [Malania oleifera]